MTRPQLMELVARLLERRRQARLKGESGRRYLVQAIDELIWWRADQKVQWLQMDYHKSWKGQEEVSDTSTWWGTIGIRD